MWLPVKLGDHMHRIGKTNDIDRGRQDDRDVIQGVSSCDEQCQGPRDGKRVSAQRKQHTVEMSECSGSNEQGHEHGERHTPEEIDQQQP